MRERTKKRFLFLFLLFAITGFTCHLVGNAQTYTIGVKKNSPPMEYLTQNNTFMGIDVDIMKRISELEDFKVVMVPNDFNVTLTGVQTGELDGAMAGIFKTAERSKAFDFSAGYMEAGLVFAVEKDSKITNKEMLKNKKIIVKKGSVASNYAVENATIMGWQIEVAENSEEMYKKMSLLKYEISAMIDEVNSLSYQMSKGAKLKFLGGAFLKSEYAFAVKKEEQKELLQAVNKGIATLKKSGELAEIIDRYMKDVTLPKYEMKTNNTYKIAVSVEDPPFCYRVKKNQFDGLEIKILRAIEEEEEVIFNFYYTTFEQGKQFLEDEQVEGLIASVRRIPEYEEIFDFSYPCTQTGLQLVAMETSTALNFQDFLHKKIGVESQTSAEIWLKKHQKEYGYSIVPFEVQSEAVEALENKEVSAVYMQAKTANYWVDKEKELKTITPEIESVDIGFVVKKNHSKELLNVINHGFQKLQFSGEWQVLLEKDIYASQEEVIPKTNEYLSVKKPSSMKDLKVGAFVVVAVLGIGTCLFLQRKKHH